MSVKAPPDFIPLQQFDDLPALITPIAGRIVEKNHLVFIASGLQGGFQPDQLPAEHLFIMSTAPVFFEKPAPGTADGPSVVFLVIIV